jgi:hypothetical protein
MLGELIAQRSVDIKGTMFLKTILLDDKGNVFTSYTIPKIEDEKLPILPRVQIEIVQEVRDGKITAKARSIKFQTLV